MTRLNALLNATYFYDGFHDASSGLVQDFLRFQAIQLDACFWVKSTARTFVGSKSVQQF